MSSWVRVAISGAVDFRTEPRLARGAFACVWSWATATFLPPLGFLEVVCLWWCCWPGWNSGASACNEDTNDCAFASSVMVRRPPNCLPELSAAWPFVLGCPWMWPAWLDLSPLEFLLPLGPCAIPPCICPLRPLPLVSPCLRPIFPRLRVTLSLPVSAAEASALEGSVDGGWERGAIDAGRKASTLSLFVLFTDGASCSLLCSGVGVIIDSEPLCKAGACWWFRLCFPHLFRGLELVVGDRGRDRGAGSAEAMIAAKLEECCSGKWARILQHATFHKCTVQFVTDLNLVRLDNGGSLVEGITEPK